MYKSKKFIVAGSISIGIGLGALLFTPQGMNAASNVVLASVDWVNSQINPINTKVSSLEAKINSQQKEIENLKIQLAKGNTPSPPQTTQPNPGSNEESTTYFTNKNAVKVHSGATRDYKVVSTLSKNISLKVIDTFKSSTGLWYRVELSSTLKGWIHSEDVSTTKSESTSSPTKVITSGNVHLRKGATTNYSIIQTIPAGTTLKYIQTFTNANGEYWYNVETSEGVKGWIIGSLGEVK